MVLSHGPDLEEMVSVQSLAGPVTQGNLRNLLGPQFSRLEIHLSVSELRVNEDLSVDSLWGLASFTEHVCELCAHFYVQ